MKKLFGCVLLALVCAGCKKDPPAFQGVKLQDDSPGFMVDCKEWDETSCLTFAKQVCPNGHHMLNRNVGNHPNLLLISCY